MLKNGKQFTANVKNIAKLIDRPVNQVYNFVSGHASVGRKMAVRLEDACKALKLDCPKEVWVWGTAAQKKKCLK